MKKAILSFGLFSLMVLTSFTTPDTGGRGQAVDSPKKLDNSIFEQTLPLTLKSDSDTGGGGQSVDVPKKLDFETGGGGQSIDNGKKLD